MRRNDKGTVSLVAGCCMWSAFICTRICRYGTNPYSWARGFHVPNVRRIYVKKIVHICLLVLTLWCVRPVIRRKPRPRLFYARSHKRSITSYSLFDNIEIGLIKKISEYLNDFYLLSVRFLFQCYFALIFFI